MDTRYDKQKTVLHVPGPGWGRAGERERERESERERERERERNLVFYAQRNLVFYAQYGYIRARESCVYGLHETDIKAYQCTQISGTIPVSSSRLYNIYISSKIIYIK